MMWLKTLAVSALVLSAASALAQGAPRLTPLVVDGERYFKLQWEGADYRGRPAVRGYILNDFGFSARRVRLLIDSLDTAGAVTAQTIAYVAGDLTPGSRHYFEAPVPAAAASYRVLVFQWEWMQSDGDGQIRR